MRRVAEIIYVVENEREAFLDGAIHPDAETERVLWLCGVRKQQYFSLNEFIFMTFEYEGNDFNGDMNKMALYLDSKGLLVKQRRKDILPEKRSTTNWWAPVKKLGTVLDHKPAIKESVNYNLMDLLDGSMTEYDSYSNISYDEDDWSEEFRI